MQYDKLGLFIKEKRKALNISLNKFATANEIDSAILSRIENLKQNIKMNVLINVAKGFSQTPAQFLVEFEKSNFCVTEPLKSPQISFTKLYK